MATWKKTRQDRRGQFCDGLPVFGSREEADRVVQNSARAKFRFFCAYCEQWHVKRAKNARNRG